MQSVLEVVVWLIFGGVVGWIASIIMGTNRQQGLLANIVIGVVGALLGGYIFRALGWGGTTGFNLASLLIAVIGAVILIAILKLFTGGFKRSEKS